MGRFILLLACHEFAQFTGEQGTDAASALGREASRSLQQLTIDCYGNVVLARGGHGFRSLRQLHVNYVKQAWRSSPKRGNLAPALRSVGPCVVSQISSRSAVALALPPISPSKKIVMPGYALVFEQPLLALHAAAIARQ